MISYYSAVFVTALLLLGLLLFAVRNGSSNQKILVFKVVGLTTGIALLLPTLLNVLTLLQTGLLMAVLAAVAGAFIPVAELLPVKMKASENQGLTVKEAVTTETKEPIVRKTPKDPPVEELTDSDEIISESVQDEDAIVCEEVDSEKDMSKEIDSEKDMSKEIDSEEDMSEEVDSEEDMSEVEDEEIVLDEEVQVVEGGAGGIVLPAAFSETMAEIMLMNGYLALKEDEEDEAVDSFIMVCQRAQVTDQRMMAYMELKLLLPETGRMMELIYLSDGLLEGEVALTALQSGYIEKHAHYLKRLVSLLNAHGVSLEQPYSAMPDELKEMAMTHQK